GRQPTGRQRGRDVAQAVVGVENQAVIAGSDARLHVGAGGDVDRRRHGGRRLAHATAERSQLDVEIVQTGAGFAGVDVQVVVEVVVDRAVDVRVGRIGEHAGDRVAILKTGKRVRTGIDVGRHHGAGACRRTIGAGQALAVVRQRARAAT